METETAVQIFMSNAWWPKHFCKVKQDILQSLFSFSQIPSSSIFGLKCLFVFMSVSFVSSVARPKCSNADPHWYQQQRQHILYIWPLFKYRIDFKMLLWLNIVGTCLHIFDLLDQYSTYKVLCRLCSTPLPTFWVLSRWLHYIYFYSNCLICIKPLCLTFCSTFVVCFKSK